MRGNPDNLRRAAQAKHDAATARAEQGLRQLIRQGNAVTFRGLAQAAGVSLDFLYRHPDIRPRVERLRAQQRSTPLPAPEKPDPDQPSSVIRTLTLQLTDLKRRHREETAQLRQALEAAHGEIIELRRRLGPPHDTSPGTGIAGTAGSQVMPAIPIDAGDAVELAELLEFLRGWLASDHDNLAASLARFVGAQVTALAQSARTSPGFRFLLGFTDGEALFSPGER